MTVFEKLQILPTRNERLEKLFEVLPRRGPAAFTIFQEVISADHPWLSDRLLSEYYKITGKPRNVNRIIVRSINEKLIPLVFEDFEVKKVNSACQGDELVDTLEELVDQLATNCMEALGKDRPLETQANIPLHVLIHGRVKKLNNAVCKMEKQRDDVTRKLNREIKELKTEEVKLRHELEGIKKTRCSRCDKRESKNTQNILNDEHKMLKRHMQEPIEIDRLKRENEKLKSEISQLKTERSKPKNTSNKDKQRVADLQNKLDVVTKEVEILRVENNVLKMQLPSIQ